MAQNQNVQEQSEIRYLTPPSVDVKKKKYCRFKKAGIKYIDYKDPEFLKKFLNEQGKILPRLPAPCCASCEESPSLGSAALCN